jgi:hypothetical protein
MLGATRGALLGKSVFLVCMAAFLAFPLVNDLCSFVPEKAPAGIAMAPAAPKLSQKSFATRSWQRALERRAKQYSGLWAPLTHCANEVYSRAFGQISAFTGGSVLQGRDRYLFQTAHLSALNHRRPKNMNILAARIAKIKRLQDLLQERGKTLIIVVTPNLATLYPDLIPENYLDPSRFKRQHPYIAVQRALEEHKIAYVDTVELLRAAGARYPFRFFARTASHWNDVASCLALQAINSKLKELGGRSFRTFSCERYTLEAEPRAKDLDLVQIANLLFPERLYGPTPYVEVSYHEAELESQPGTLLVGTSYLFAISEHLYTWNLAKSHKLFFYFRQWREGGKRSFRTLSRQQIQWDDVFKNDIFIVNVGIGNPATIGYGFIEAALAELEKR